MLRQRAPHDRLATRAPQPLADRVSSALAYRLDDALMDRVSQPLAQLGFRATQVESIRSLLRLDEGGADLIRKALAQDIANLLARGFRQALARGVRHLILNRLPHAIRDELGHLLLPARVRGASVHAAALNTHASAGLHTEATTGL
jgi:hypothetical protein